MKVDTGRLDGARVDPETLTVNELVTRAPETLPLLADHGIDTCCGGALTVAEACRRHGVDPARILGHLGADSP